MDTAETRYAKSGDVSIAYQVVGDGPYDLVFVPPFTSTIERMWGMRRSREGLLRLAEFARLVILDKRGTGMSDRVPGMPPLEERMDDVRAVLDAVGSARAAVLGVSEGGPMSVLFAATYPDRCFALVFMSSSPRFAWAADWPWGATQEEDERDIADIEGGWGTDELVAKWYPAVPEDERALIARHMRLATTPGGAVQLHRMNRQIDVRDILPTIAVPALVVHRTGDELDVRGARYTAEHIPGARLVELPGDDHFMFAADADRVITEIRSFLDEAWQAGEPEPERVLATVLFTDIVGSTAKAVELGDRRWAELVAAHHERVRRELARHRGRELDTAGDGFFAAFDGPARAIRCACAIRDAVRELGIEIRAGLHTGECEHVDGKVAGIAVSTGARVAALAGPDEVLVSATVRDLVAGSGLAFEDRGLHALKGIPEERRLYAVV